MELRIKFNLHDGKYIYKEGDVVRAKVNPTLLLDVRRYVDRIYYCRIQQNPIQKELVYFERELIPPDIKNIGKMNSGNIIRKI